jgi:hypothetical protein
MKSVFLAVVLVLAGCGGVESIDEEEQAVSGVCTKAPMYCPPECKHVGNACPQKCSCPGYTACGPSLKCNQHDDCCTAGPISIDPAQNHYMCVPPGTACPL